MIEKKTLRILCFGDSLTEGYTNYGLVFRPYSTTLKTVLSWELDGKRGLESWGGDDIVSTSSREGGKEKGRVEGNDEGLGLNDEEAEGEGKGEHGKERWEIEVVTKGVSGEMVGEMGERMRGVCEFLFLCFLLFFGLWMFRGGDQRGGHILVEAAQGKGAMPSLLDLLMICTLGRNDLVSALAPVS